MKILLAPDSFKNCLRSRDVCRFMAYGVRQVCPEAKIIHFPLADGGEGTLDAVESARGGIRQRFPVTGPLGIPGESEALLLDHGQRAVIECAGACGIEAVPRKLLSPLWTTSFGVGELLRQLETHGVEETWLGLGGSATVDGGLGMLQALGAKLLDHAGEELPAPATGTELLRLNRLLPPPPLRMRLRLVVDVRNPLCGPAGAAQVFGPQKGMTPEDIPRFDAALRHYAQQAEDPGEMPGDGAAGGLGFACRRFLGGVGGSGAELLLKLTGFDAALSGATLVITGEGRSDAQTAQGKLPAVVAAHAAAAGVPVLLISGALAEDAAELQSRFALLAETRVAAWSLEENILRASELLQQTVARILDGYFRK